VKGAGYGIYFTAPFGTVRTRMYRNFRAMWQGWTKNLYPLMGGKPTVVLLEIADVFPWLVAPAWFLPGLVAALIVGRMFRYGMELYRNLYPVAYIKYYVPGLCLYCVALLASWWKNTRGVVHWKGRAYPARTA
jgi:hypothetical protein